MGQLSDPVIARWRGSFTNEEANFLHALAFRTRVFTEAEWNWVDLTARHSLGWVTARSGDLLVGFVNVVWDGLVHAWIQDLMVHPDHQHRGIGTRVITEATAGARAAGCEWLHVDFDDEHRDFYFGACGFPPTNAGLLRLQ